MNDLAPYHPATPLAQREDLRVGEGWVRPALLTVEGPRGSAKAEPRVIQVLLALADARGRVLSRDDLLRLCWDNRIVGDDAVNRAIAGVRRLAQATGAGFEVETVPRVGYRLTGLDWEAAPELASGRPDRIDRRTLLAGGAAALVVAAGGGIALVQRQRSARIDALIERGRVIQGSGGPQAQVRAEALFSEAIRRDDGRADAWGWLAAVLGDYAAAREAAQQALARDPREPNARTVLAFQQRDLEAWTRWEDALLGVLGDAPDCAAALAHLTFFYQGMGRCKASWEMNERAIAVEPFNPTHHYRRATKHYIFGRVGEADKVADRAVQLWSRNGNVWNARMLIYAFTDRAEAGLALLSDTAVRPVNLTAPSIEAWRATLAAVANRAAIPRAVEVYERVAPLAIGLAANAIMTFSYLGEVDTAYRFAEALFVNQGAAVQRNRAGSIDDMYARGSWGRTQFLFIPAAAPMRADARFPGLCQRLGHVAYWRTRGVWPDPFVRGAIDPARLG